LNSALARCRRPRLIKEPVVPDKKSDSGSDHTSEMGGSSEVAELLTEMGATEVAEPPAEMGAVPGASAPGIAEEFAPEVHNF
jgi:hypothetical protein